MHGEFWGRSWSGILDCDVIIIFNRRLIIALTVLYSTADCHRTVCRAALLSVPFFTHQITAAVDSVHGFGVTATPERKDGAERHIRFGLGRIVGEIAAVECRKLISACRMQDFFNQLVV